LVEVVVEEDRPFCRQHWYKLPLKMRRRWWRETSYGTREPSSELVEAIRTAPTTAADA